MSQVSEEQLRELSMMLTPVIARYLGESATDTSVSISCTPINAGEPDGAAVMSFDVKVRGVAISTEQEEKVSQLLSTTAGPQGTVVKAKG
jgi:hypothetical protein